jgi:transcriptional regulator with XRE-family HTH domain
MGDTIANRLKSLRVEHDMSQRELAEYMEVSNSTISRIEKGAMPDVETLIKYAENFGVSTDWILFGKEHEE